MLCHPSKSIWSNLPREVLMQNLVNAQKAYDELIIGNKPVSVSYSQETGAKGVTYSPADSLKLLAYILELQRALGINHRYASRVRF